MRKASFVLGLCMAYVFVTLSVGQDEEQQTKAKKPRNLDLTIELYSTIMTKTFEKAELSKEQLEKIKKIIDSSIPDLVRTRDRLENMFTSEQQKTYDAALKLAIKAKYPQEKAEGYALRKLKLPEEKMVEYNQTKEKVEFINTKMNNEIAGLLTKEQKARMPMFNKAKKLSSVYAVKFPNMKSSDDAKAIWKNLMAIEGANDFTPDLDTQIAKFKVPRGLNLKKEISAMVDAGQEILTGWEVIPLSKLKPGTTELAEPEGADSSAGKTPTPAKKGS